MKQQHGTIGSDKVDELTISSELQSENNSLMGKKGKVTSSTPNHLHDNYEKKVSNAF